MKKYLRLIFLSTCLLSSGVALCKDNQHSALNFKKLNKKANISANRIYLDPKAILINESGIAVTINGSSFRASQIHHDKKGFYILCGDLVVSQN